MKQSTLLILASLGLAISPPVQAQTVDGSMLYTPNVDVTTLPQNGFVGTVGGIFLTSYNYYPQVNWLGYADPTGAALTDSHLVSLWDNSTGDVIASATVPAGTAAPLYDGFRWVQLPSTVQLTYNAYYVIGAQTDGVDLWGDLISNNSPDTGNNGQVTWDPQYIQIQTGYEFSRDGRYDSAGNYPAEPPNSSGNDSIYPAANLGYNLPVPEPSAVWMFCLGGGLLGAIRKWRK
jgi:hypothetical protein